MGGSQELNLRQEQKIFEFGKQSFEIAVQEREKNQHAFEKFRIVFEKISKNLL